MECSTGAQATAQAMRGGRWLWVLSSRTPAAPATKLQLALGVLGAALSVSGEEETVHTKVRGWSLCPPAPLGADPGSETGHSCQNSCSQAQTLGISFILELRPQALWVGQ